MTKLRTAALILLALASPAAAIELSLEENRAERGSVGYVDMQTLFAASPDARRAKEGFEDLVRQAEEQVNSRKAELLRLRQELDAFKIEREALAQSTPSVLAPAPSIPPAKRAPEPVVTPAPAAPVPPLAPVTAPAAARPEPAAAPKPPLLAINLPGLATGPLMLEPEAAAQTPAPTPVPAPAPTSAPAPAPTPAPAPVSEPLKEIPSPSTFAQRIIELDGLIAGKQAEIDRKESELTRERLGAEKSLTDVESRKTDQVLARLYRAIAEVARKEGVSVVVEKTVILYGHNAVDLTDKVLKHLRGAAPAPLSQ